VSLMGGELLLSVSLAFDCLAIALSLGMRGIQGRSLGILALCFGGFQGGMLALGILGSQLLSLIFAQYMSWIAAALLFWIGLKMLKEGFEKEEDSEDIPVKNIPWATYISLSIATSIDALAAGLTLPTLNLAPGVSLVGVTLCSFGFALIGGHYGKRWGEHLGQYAEVVGGVVLCALGFKALW
jgi:manganese efflux pump family protein